MKKIQKNKIVIIYHDKCSDGLTSAGIAKYFLNKKGYVNIEMVGGKYHEDPPIIEDSHIFFVDFCYKRTEMESLLHDSGNYITLIDHHISAINEVRHLFEHPRFDPYISEDNTRSGTGLAWDYFSNGQELPIPFTFIQDRDLWTWFYPDSKPYLAVHNLRDKTLDAYEVFVKETIENPLTYAEMSDILSKGDAILEAMDQVYDETIASSLRFMDILGYRNIPTVNCPGYFMSDIGASLVNKYDAPFSLMWYCDEKGMKIGLRSKSDKSGEDVSKLANTLHVKGGGHYAAAGAMIPREEFNSNPHAMKILIG